MVLPAREDEGDLVHVVADELSPIHQPVHCIVGLELICTGHALPASIEAKDRTGCLTEVPAREEAVVRLEVELEASPLEP